MSTESVQPTAPIPVSDNVVDLQIERFNREVKRGVQIFARQRHLCGCQDMFSCIHTLAILLGIDASDTVKEVN